MFDRPPQQPQSVGDIIGRGFRLFRHNVPLLVRAQIMPCIVMTVGHILIQVAVSYGLRNPKSIPSFALGLGTAGIGMAVSLVGLWLLTIRQFAFVRLANGLADSFEDAFKFAQKKKWTVIGLFFLSYFFGIGVFIFWAIELFISVAVGAKVVAVAVFGVTFGLFGLLFSLGVLSIYYLIVVAAIACEDIRWSTIIARGFSLVGRDLGRVCGFGTLLTLIVSIFSYTLSLPVVALTLFELFRHGFSGQHLDPTVVMPFYCLVLTQFWQSVINMLLVPITFMSAGLFYRDLKIRQEGLDVVQSLRLLTKTSAG